jgi:hypothetical protein
VKECNRFSLIVENFVFKKAKRVRNFANNPLFLIKTAVFVEVVKNYAIRKIKFFSFDMVTEEIFCVRF